MSLSAIIVALHTLSSSTATNSSDDTAGQSNNMQDVPGLLGQTLWGGRGDHKDSNFHSNPWSEMSWKSSMAGARNEEKQD
ncbi:hypothetical protein TNCV_182431 [Trichonephila clavipes]|nr:hypothetical protein TNCV_182431 [Trichonephila clavipes]